MELTNLINKVRNKEYPFNEDIINKYYLDYQQIMKNEVK